MNVRAALRLTVAVALPFAVLACSSSTAPTKTTSRSPIQDDDYFPEEPPPLTPDYVESDSGVPVQTRARDAGTTDGGADAGDTDASDSFVICSTSQPKELFVQEIMIASRSGSGDNGEWIEIRNTRTCAVVLNGITVESPRGTTAVDSVALSGLLKPGGTIVVADSADPKINHGIPGKVFAFGATDVLKNDGDTIRIMLGTTEIDTFTYPRLVSMVGASIALPSDCLLSDRASVERWSYSASEWTPGFKGTPNAPNNDVACF